MEFTAIIDWIKLNHKRLQYAMVLRADYKFALAWLTFFVGSFSHDFLPLPPSYLSNRKNILNVYFAKKGWGWTFFLLLGYQLFILFKYRAANWKIFKHVSRLIVLTFVWYVTISLFEFIEGFTGSCLSDTAYSKELCHTHGHLWSGFDISGHCFLLLFNILVINEELLRTIDFCVPSCNGLHDENVEEPGHYQDIYGFKVEEKHLTFGIEFFTCSLVFLMILWEIMLFFTCAYFHTLFQKFLGMIIAYAAWYVCYRIIFTIDLPFAPSIPSLVDNNYHQN